MSTLAALCSGVSVALAVGAVSGHLPRLRLRPAPAGRASPLAVLLVQAGLPHVRPRTVLGLAGTGALAAAVVTATMTQVVALGAVPAVLVVAAPRALLRRRAARYTRERRRAWPDALAHIAAGVRAGRPLSHALVDVSLTGPPALRAPLEGLAARIQTVGLEAALASVRDLMADPVADRVVEVLMLAHAQGGGIVVQVLDDLADAVSEEVVAAEEQETLLLEGTINARAVVALPWMVLIAMTAQAGPFRDFYASPRGAAVIAVAAVMSVVGSVLVGRLSRPPEQPRVLVGVRGGGR